MVLDTSALMAVVLDAPETATCMAAIEVADGLVMSGGTLAETLIVARRRGVGATMQQLIADIAPDVVPVTEPEALRVAAAYDRSVEGFIGSAQPGRLLRLALANSEVALCCSSADDFARTDLTSAL